jgi:hypothetical protein
MTAFACPKCRGALPDAALDAGSCSACGFPLDGPLPALAPPRSARPFVFGALALLIACAAGFAIFAPRADEPQPAVEVARAEPRAPVAKPEVAVAPMPHEPRAKPVAIAPQPEPKIEPKIEAKIEPKPVKPGAVIQIDPFDAPKRHIEIADAEVRVPDLHGEHEIVLTGKARVLKLGSLHGRVRVDASKLDVREVVIAGDLHGDAQLVVSAPNGTVTVSGFVIGSAKLTVLAPGGAVLFAESARLDGGSTVTVTAKALTVRGPMLGGTKLSATLTTGGALKLTTLEGGATATYRKEKPSDPPLTVDAGDARGGAKVVAE